MQETQAMWAGSLGQKESFLQEEMAEILDADYTLLESIGAADIYLRK